ncbi:MAG: stage II sporulation protein M [Candidatus Aenigmatarchaeota archaeon]
MLESLVSFREINERPYLTAIWSFVICSIAVLISHQIPMAIPGTSAGFLVVLFSMIPSIYFITALIKKEERLEESYINHDYQVKFWTRHGKDIFILLFYFGGLVAAFAAWSFILPQDFFFAQVSKINEIQGITGAVTGGGGVTAAGGVTADATTFATSMESFGRIFLNNLQVMLFSFVFSFIFGAGAIFIIVWNASVLGVYIGQLSKYAWHIPIVSLSFLPHGIFEIGGYVTAGLAGGLVSAAIIRKNSLKVLKIITLDSFKIIVLATVLILIGAAIEVLLA